jgi:hypothetical protein
MDIFINPDNSMNFSCEVLAIENQKNTKQNKSPE